MAIFTRTTHNIQMYALLMLFFLFVCETAIDVFDSYVAFIHGYTKQTELFSCVPVFYWQAGRSWPLVKAPCHLVLHSFACYTNSTAFIQQ
jgi:hypothetical protein